MLKYLTLCFYALTMMAGCSGSGSNNAAPAPTPLPAYCTASNVVHYDLPIYWGQPGSPTFTYYFQIQLATVGTPSTAPVGIVLPGGPGAPSIGYPSGTIFPPSFNVIYTDVRGVGCNINSVKPFGADALTTEYFARDVLSIVQVLGLKKYVLFGVSYGTVQATVMTSIAQNEGIQTPSALVLEGILGNWQINSQSVGLNTEWTKAKALLPTSVAASFSQTPLPLGYSSDDWISFLTANLNAGTTPSLGNNTVHYLAPLGSSDPAVVNQAKADIQNKMTEIKAGWKPEIVRLATTLWCTETAGSLYAKGLVNGSIVNTGSDQCPLLGFSFIKPYDSALYPVTVPIYYFEGSDDPNTTPADAAYHFNNQTQADRVFTSVTGTFTGGGGGHTAMSGTLHEAGCTPAIFTAIATNPSATASNKTVIEACSWPVVITTRAAGL